MIHHLHVLGHNFENLACPTYRIVPLQIRIALKVKMVQQKDFLIFLILVGALLILLFGSFLLILCCIDCCDRCQPLPLPTPRDPPLPTGLPAPRDWHKATTCTVSMMDSTMCSTTPLHLPREEAWVLAREPVRGAINHVSRDSL